MNTHGHYSSAYLVPKHVEWFSLNFGFLSIFTFLVVSIPDEDLGLHLP